MKTALCLSGYFGTISTGDFSTGLSGYDYLRKHILDKLNVDVFVHNWQPEIEPNIKKIYKPKLSLFENQIDFNIICQQNGIDQSYIDKNFPRHQTMYVNATFSRILSFYYSRSKALELCFQHEENIKEKYDWVIVSRFDIDQRGGESVRKLKFDKALDNNFFYTAHWNQMNVGYGDMWHFANSDNMKKYAKIYEHGLIDFKPHSDFEKALTGGWFDSNMFNVYDVNDPRQLTNEVLKPKDQRSKTLMKFPTWRVSDSHLHHKWFAAQSGLYEITRWI